MVHLNLKRLFKCLSVKVFKKNRNIDIENINISFGSKAKNKFDLRNIDASEVTKLKALIEDRGMFVIPSHQVLSETEQIKITKYFGNTDSDSISYISANTKVKSKTGTSDNTYLSSELWHNDEPYLKNPPHISIFQMVDSVNQNVDDVNQNWETTFTSLHDICSNITEEVKLKWNSIHIMYSGNDVIHPLLWIHPFTGRQSIYFDFRFVKQIFSICKNTGEILIKSNNEIVSKLYKLFSSNKDVYNHKWCHGDIIIIDNYAISRRQTLKPSYDNPALVRRTTTAGLYF